MDYASAGMSGYIRLTSSFHYDANSSNLLTGDNIGIIGHTYTLTMTILDLNVTIQSYSELRLDVLDTTGNVIGSFTIADSTTASGTNLSNTTQSCTFTLADYIDCIVLYTKGTKSSTSMFDFVLKLEDITE